MKLILLTLLLLCLPTGILAQDVPPAIVIPPDPPAKTDWNQVIITLGGQIVIILGVIFTYLKSRHASNNAVEAKINAEAALEQGIRNSKNIAEGRMEAKADVVDQTKHLTETIVKPLLATLPKKPPGT